MKPAERRQLRAIANDLVRTPPVEHINKVMFNEGKRDALDIANACQALLRSPTGRGSLVTKLKIASAGRPASYAKGIRFVIDLLEKEGVQP
jgi:hypothetical protein